MSKLAQYKFDYMLGTPMYLALLNDMYYNYNMEILSENMTSGDNQQERQKV
ncbi:MAG: hypothetical protein ACFFG0_05210 [Candidatus Thorarchaeota archaeon]